MKDKAHVVGGSGKCRTEKKWNVSGMVQSARLEISKRGASRRASSRPSEQHNCSCRWNQNLLL